MVFFNLNTLSYTLEEHIILQRALQIKFKLETNIHKHGNKFKLYIKAKFLNNFRNLVLPYFSDSFFFFINYMLNLNKYVYGLA